MYDYLIVGAGLFGSVFAQQATENGYKCLVIDKNDYIGGNCHTKKIENIDVHIHGPHIFHCSDENIWNYMNRWTKFNNFVNRPKVCFKNNIYSFPINLMTLYQLWGVKSPKEAKEKLDSVKIHCQDPKNLEEWILSQVGKEIYETFIEGYTQKQWKRHPSELPSSIIKRLPIRTTWDDNYFNDKYQGIPIGGYTRIFEQLLEGSEVLLGTDFFKEKKLLKKLSKKIVYTGKLDQYYDYCLGKLEYRGLNFETKVMDVDDFQGNAVINYTEKNIPYTRITEHKHFDINSNHNQNKTVISYEFPDDWDDSKTPYYPINDEKNNAIKEQYRKLSENDKNVIFGGRLANYVYYDMHQIVASSLHTWSKEGKNR